MYRKYLGLWVGLCFWSSVLPVFIVSQLNGFTLWGDKYQLQSNLQRCHPGIPDQCVLHHWCEAMDLEKGVRSPFTSYSNLGFMLLGCLIITQTYYDTPSKQIVNHLKHYHPISYHYGWIMWWAGFSSFICHASGTALTRELDRSGVLGIVLYPVWIALYRFVIISLQPFHYKRGLVVFYVVWIGLTLYYADLNEITNDIYQWVPIIVVCLILLVYLEEVVRCCFIKCIEDSLPINTDHLPTYYLDTPHYLFIIVLFWGILGYLLQDPERIGLECHPNQPWYHQTHGYWHICIAITFYTLWLVFWNEKIKQVNN